MDKILDFLKSLSPYSPALTTGDQLSSITMGIIAVVGAAIGVVAFVYRKMRSTPVSTSNPAQPTQVVVKQESSSGTLQTILWFGFLSSIFGKRRQENDPAGCPPRSSDLGHKDCPPTSPPDLQSSRLEPRAGVDAVSTHGYEDTLADSFDSIPGAAQSVQMSNTVLISDVGPDTTFNSVNFEPPDMTGGSFLVDAIDGTLDILVNIDTDIG